MCSKWFTALANMVFHIMVDLVLVIFYGRFIYYLNGDDPDKEKSGYCATITQDGETCPDTIWFPFSVIFILLHIASMIILIGVFATHVTCNCFYRFEKNSDTSSRLEGVKKERAETYLWVNGALFIDLVIKSAMTLSIYIVNNRDLWPKPIEPELEKEQLLFGLKISLLIKSGLYIFWIIMMSFRSFRKWWKRRDANEETSWCDCFKSSHPKAQTVRMKDLSTNQV